MDDLTITTLDNWSKDLSDNVTAHSPLLSKLKENGGYVYESGGETLTEGIDSAENGTFMWYAGYDVFNVTPCNVLSVASFPWKQAGAVVMMSGLEKRNNKDNKLRRYNMLASRMQNCERTLINNVSASSFSDGTGSDGKELGGLGLLVADDPSTGTVGGIDAADNAWWRNQVYSFAAQATAVSKPTPADMLAAMDAMMLACTRNADMPDLIICSSDYFSLYKQAVQAVKRITTDRVSIGDASFRALEYEGVPVVYDSFCPAGHMYFLNTKYIKLRVHEDADFARDTERLPVNMDASVYPIIFQGNFTVSNRNLQGVVCA